MQDVILFTSRLGYGEFTGIKGAIKVSDFDSTLIRAFKALTMAGTGEPIYTLVEGDKVEFIIPYTKLP